MNKKRKDIVLLGGGGHCKSCIDVIEQQDLYRIIGILDMPELTGTKISGYEIIGTDDDIPVFAKTVKDFFITIGQIKSSVKRMELFELIKSFNLSLPVIFSPLAYVAQSARIGEGSIIMHQALVNTEAIIGKNCIINSKALIEHEAVVGDFCHISTGSILNGQVNTGDNCFVGSNTVVANNIDICSNTVIAAGSQVMRNIKLPGIYIGNPLRKIR